VPAQVDEDIALPPVAFDAPAELNAAINNGSFAGFVADLPPQRHEYAFLREALAHYRQAEADGDWSVPVKAGQALNGLSHVALAKLTQRLAADDPDVAVRKTALSGAALRSAIQRFQHRFGLSESGALTADTVKLLNQPASDRVLQIEANMERWRWLPRVPDERYVEVNTAAATLKVVENGKTLLTSPVVVGRTDWATPIVATAVDAVVVNPPWHVPPELAGEEMLPKLVRDPGYLATHNMVLVDGPQGDPHGKTVKWKDVPANPFPYRIEQLPGPRSGLGALLLDMPNAFGVYLHDTPEKELFGYSNRLLSHGCVRVRAIDAVASYALFGDTQDAAKIPRPPRSETERIPLEEPLPVYMLYWTVFQDPDGMIAFRRDAYGFDVQVVAALYGKKTHRSVPAPTEAVVAESKLPAP
jgi:murein L,D-transpeptidase YcbB/YkuD